MRILAFRLARSGLAGEPVASLAQAAACPASDFARYAALTALAARAEGVTREGYDRATDNGDLLVAHAIRGAIHAMAPGDRDLWGRALVGADERELTAQIGRRIWLEGAEGRRTLVDSLAEVVAATQDALAAGPLDRVELHQALRERVHANLLPWCEVCRNHHVAGRLWRYATIVAGARLDSARRYVLEPPGRTPEPGEPVLRFLHFYGPSDPATFAGWAGVTPKHARRLWATVADDLVEVDGHGWIVAADADALADPPPAEGIRLLPPGDPYLQAPNRELIAPDPELRKRLFRPVASPGVVLHDGRLAGLWRGKAIAVEPFEPLPQPELADAADRLRAVLGG